MSNPVYSPEVRDAALAVIGRHGLWHDALEGVRDGIIDGDPDKARRLLAGGHGLAPHEVDAVMDYYDPAVKGVEVRFEEIAPEDVCFGGGEAEDDEVEDPLNRGERYFARRGLDIGEMTTAIFGDISGEQIPRVFFRGRMLSLDQLDQIWRISANP